MKRLRLLIALLVLLSSLLLVSKVEATAVYSIDTVDLAPAGRATKCFDDTCDDYETLYAFDVDVTDRPDAVAVDVCIFGDTDTTFSSATITSTGSLYTGSYINDNTWTCGASSGTLGTVTTGTGWKCGLVTTDMLFCKMRIDENSNARVSLSGRLDAPYECASDTQSPSSIPNHERFIAADLYKHTDSTKSDSDSYSDFLSCWHGDESTYADVHLQYATFYNAGTYFAPTGTPFKMHRLDLDQFNNTVTGPITYKWHATTPTWVVVTSCPITVNAGALSAPGNPSACTITNSGHTLDATLTFNAAIDLDIDIYGTIGSIPECPSVNIFTKDLYTQNWFYRDFDGAWAQWANLTRQFGCS